MKNKLLCILFLIFNVTYAQNTVGTISITEDAFDGLTLFTINTKTFLINNCGETINQWNSSYLPGNAVYLLPNGNLLRAGKLEDGSSDIAFGGQGGIVELFDWENNLLWSYTYSSNNFRQHHDVYPLPNGNILMLAATVITSSEAIQAGRDPSLLIDNELYNEQILELEPVGTDDANIVWEWNVKDHLIQDFDNTKDNFGAVETDPGKIDVNFTNGGNGGNNWLHFNSIQYNDARNQIVISTRNLSEIWIIDHSTTTAESASSTGGVYGRGGDILYRWGNPMAYRQGNSADRTLFGQHSPSFITSGLPNEDKIILFNNGFQRSPAFSQVDIISPPELSEGVYEYIPNTAYAPIATDFTYSDQSSDPSEFFSGILSSAQQLPNGNILICEGRDGHIFEINESGTKVWDYVNPIDNTTGDTVAQMQAPPSGNLLFRVTKYPLDFPAFTGRDLTPGPTLETNPDSTPCDNLSITDSEKSLVSLYPNPTQNKIQINTTAIIDKVEIFNVLGYKISETKNSEIDLSQNTSGIYFLKIHSGLNVISRKVVKN